MKRKGFTLLELIISISLMLTVLGATYGLLGVGFRLNKQVVMEKELMEIAEQFQRLLITEFSQAGSIEAVLDQSGRIHSSLGSDPIEVKSIKLVSSNRPMQLEYQETLIFLKDYSTDYRHSVWMVKGKTKNSVDVSASMHSTAYEIGTLVEEIQIKHIEKNIYQLDLFLTYFDTNIHHTKSFFVSLQN